MCSIAQCSPTTATDSCLITTKLNKLGIWPYLAKGVLVQVFMLKEISGVKGQRCMEEHAIQIWFMSVQQC